MATWWLAIDIEHSNYNELRCRRVIAQGWSQLGDIGAWLVEMRQEPEATRRDRLRERLDELGYGERYDAGIVPQNTGTCIANFFWNIHQGDLVVGKEGGAVRGICKIPEVNYRFNDCRDENNVRRFEYAHEFGPVEWFDWTDVFGDWMPPNNPQQPAAAHVNENAARIEGRFEEFLRKEARVRNMDELAEIIEMQRQIIFTGPPGTGKTREAKRLTARLLTGQAPPDDISGVLEQFRLIPGREASKEGAWDIVQFHPSYNYDDFVCGIRMQNGAFILRDGPFLRMVEAAQATPDGQFVLIIDEINRANVAAVLGELIYALEYRGEPVTLQYNDRSVIVPKNLFVIGTMNTADRSIGHLDYAVRRRFSFISLTPDRAAVEKWHRDHQTGIGPRSCQAFQAVATLFADEEGFLSADYQTADVQPGHSYFLAENTEELSHKIKYQVVPLLKEYVADGVLRPEAIKGINDLKNDFGGV